MNRLSLTGDPESVDLAHLKLSGKLVTNVSGAGLSGIEVIGLVKSSFTVNGLLYEVAVMSFTPLTRHRNVPSVSGQVI